MDALSLFTRSLVAPCAGSAAQALGWRFVSGRPDRRPFLKAAELKSIPVVVTLASGLRREFRISKQGVVPGRVGCAGRNRAVRNRDVGGRDCHEIVPIVSGDGSPRLSAQRARTSAGLAAVKEVIEEFVVGRARRKSGRRTIYIGLFASEDSRQQVSVTLLDHGALVDIMQGLEIPTRSAIHKGR